MNPRVTTTAQPERDERPRLDFQTMPATSAGVGWGTAHRGPVERMRREKGGLASPPPNIRAHAVGVQGGECYREQWEAGMTVSMRVDPTREPVWPGLTGRGKLALAPIHPSKLI